MANPEHLKILKQTVEAPHAFKLAKYGVRGPEAEFEGVKGPTGRPSVLPSPDFRLLPLASTLRST